jgi:hypothetical protein
MLPNTNARLGGVHVYANNLVRKNVWHILQTLILGSVASSFWTVYVNAAPPLRECIEHNSCVFFPQDLSSQRSDTAQLNCDISRRTYDQAHTATAASDYNLALKIMHQIKSSMPRECRLESDEMLDTYVANMKKLISQKEADGPPTLCQPLQTGPTSYSCWSSYK